LAQAFRFFAFGFAAFGWGGIASTRFARSSRRLSASAWFLSLGVFAMCEPEYLDMPQVPPIELYTLSGMVNHAWATLDAFVSAAFIATLDIDAVEVGVTVGRLETKAKLEKLKKIYRHRRNGRMVELLTSIARVVEDNKGLRNAMTHGRYLAKTRKGEYLWSVLPEFLISEKAETANQLYVATDAEIMAHAQLITNQCELVLNNFDVEAMNRLFGLPTRAL